LHMDWSSGVSANSNVEDTCGFGSVGTRLRYGVDTVAVRLCSRYGVGTAGHAR
jgi:hypothetical protein